MSSKRKTLKQIAAENGVTPRYVRRCCWIINDGVPELFDWHAAGLLSLSAADLLSQLPRTLQREITIHGPAMTAEIARHISAELRNGAKRRLRKGDFDLPMLSGGTVLQ